MKSYLLTGEPLQALISSPPKHDHAAPRWLQRTVGEPNLPTRRTGIRRCVRLEDDMVITETGAALFTPQSGSLEKPFQAYR